MGLDMYLQGMPRIEGLTFEELANLDIEELHKTQEHPYHLVAEHIELKGEHYKWLSIKEDIGYWRKANAIHKWFVENVQDGVDECDPYEVTKEHVEELLEVCENVLEDKSVADELLPTTSGFFFGSTDYDQYYFQDIRHTVKVLKKVLKKFDFENNYLMYQSSW